MFKGMPFIEPWEGAITYAMIEMGYHTADLFKLLFLEDSPPDFWEMLLHHISTFLLIVSMLMCN